MADEEEYGEAYWAAQPKDKNCGDCVHLVNQAGLLEFQKDDGCVSTVCEPEDMQPGIACICAVNDTLTAQTGPHSCPWFSPSALARIASTLEQMTGTGFLMRVAAILFPAPVDGLEELLAEADKDGEPH